MSLSAKRCQLNGESSNGSRTSTILLQGTAVAELPRFHGCLSSPGYIHQANTNTASPMIDANTPRKIASRQQ